MSTSGQFSLRFLLALILVLSIILAISFAFPPAHSCAGLLCFSTAVFTVLVVSIIHGRGDFRVFCVGAIIPMTTLAVVVIIIVPVLIFDRPASQMGVLERYAEGLRTVSIAVWLCAVFMGFLAVIARKIIESMH